MPENNFIYNDRYLLSNLTSQKLYAKSPLTTGVSGTSAFIGIEPSAQYNETVLWSGSAHDLGTDITLSEPYTAFDYLKIYANGYNTNYQPQMNEYYIDKNFTPNFYVICENRPGSTPGIRFNYYELSGHTDYTKLRIMYAWQFSITANAVINTSGSNAYINRVVGINHK